MVITHVSNNHGMDDSKIIFEKSYAQEQMIKKPNVKNTYIWTWSINHESPFAEKFTITTWNKTNTAMPHLF